MIVSSEGRYSFPQSVKGLEGQNTSKQKIVVKTGKGGEQIVKVVSAFERRFMVINSLLTGTLTIKDALAGKREWSTAKGDALLKIAENATESALKAMAFKKALNDHTIKDVSVIRKQEDALLGKILTFPKNSDAECILMLLTPEILEKTANEMGAPNRTEIAKIRLLMNYGVNFESGKVENYRKLPRDLKDLMKERTAVIKGSTFMDGDTQKQDVKGILDGKGISLRITEMKEASSDTGVFVPDAITTELPRLDLSYNGKLLTAARKKDETPEMKLPHQSVQAYELLCEELGENAATVLLLCCGQASVGEASSEAWLVAGELLRNEAPSGVAPKGQGIKCFIDVQGDSTVITVNTRIRFVDNNRVEEYQENGGGVKGYGVVTREITIPTATLKAMELEKTVDKSGFDCLKVKNTEALLPGMTVVDSYTGILPTEELAIQAQRNGYMKKG